MKTVLGAHVKSAAFVHAQKQLRALGIQFQDGHGGVKFKGTKAWAAWKQDYRNNDAVGNFRINYPSLPDNAVLSRREADLIAAYTLHELGHIAFTDNRSSGVLSGVQFRLFNGIEDGRIEHAVIRSGKAEGARSLFKALVERLCCDIGPGFNPTNINDAPFALALISRAAFGDGNEYAKRLLSRIPEPYRALYQRVVDGLQGVALNRSGTARVVELAQQFYADWKALAPVAPPQPQQPPQPQPQQPQDDESGDDGDDGDSAESGAQGGAEGDDADADEGDSDSDGEPDAPDDDEFDDEFDDVGGGDESDDFGDDDRDPGFGDDGDDADGDDESDDADDADDADGDDESHDADDADGDDGDEGDSDSQGERGSDEGEFAPAAPEEYSEERCKDPEPNVDRIFKAARKRTKDAVELPPVAESAREAVLTGDVSQERAEGVAARLNSYAAAPALKAQLRRILKATETVGWDPGALGGRFDGRRAPRLFAGSEAVFKRRWEYEGIDTVVSVVVDLSGSMSGSAVYMARDLAWCVAVAAEAARADVEVVGFQSGGTWGGGGFGSSVQMDGTYQKATKLSGARILEFKKFSDRCANVSPKFDRMPSHVGGGTPDYEAAFDAVQRLSSMPHKRKLVVVITDGLGDIPAMKLLTQNAHDLFGVDVIGFGIGIDAESFSKAYEVGCPVDLNSMQGTALKGVIKQLEKRDYRRVA